MQSRCRYVDSTFVRITEGAHQRYIGNRLLERLDAICHAKLFCGFDEALRFRGIIVLSLLCFCHFASTLACAKTPQQ